MDILQIENLSFTYPSFEDNSPIKALENISLTVTEGEFAVVCGRSGSGKSTFIRLLKAQLAPKGELQGSIKLFQKNREDVDCGEIGFVAQNPESQIVTDKVWHELAFGLENQGMSQEQMFRLVGEMAGCFGLEKQYNKETSALSGGEKQILNLASVLVMHPRLLLLDEPTAQLDPISATRFLSLLKRLNEEWGTTVIIAEHRLEECIPLADSLIVLENGRLLAKDRPEKLYAAVASMGLRKSFPVSMQLAALLGEKTSLPLTVKEGRSWLRSYTENNSIKANVVIKDYDDKKLCLEAKDIWFSYDRNEKPVLKGLDISLYSGQVLCILGGNGSGKSTMLSVLGRIKKPMRGKVKLWADSLTILPQNPESCFTADTVGEELDNLLTALNSKTDKTKICEELSITHLLNRNPYDLSGGEQQLCALAKLLLKNADCLLLDEPTKGMDVYAKQRVTDCLKELSKAGRAILVVTHDVSIAAELADKCALFFDGRVSKPQEIHQFLSGNNFYTPPISRMLKGIADDVISMEELVTEGI